LSERSSLLDTILESFAPVHSDGHKFVAAAALATLAFFWLWPPLGWLAAVATAYIAYFFRDPDHVIPMREGLVVSPADGRISSIEKIRPPAELGLGTDERVRVSVFLSVLDVHINRAPIAGRIIRSVYIPGAFLNAALDKASEENERRALVIEGANGTQVGVIQIAGLIARRIVTFSQEGESVGTGQRFGLIRFGSRVDTFLPVGRTALVSVGQLAIGGETVLADLKSDEAEREARRV
jgi:phosphatidylserine decarboxylase